MITNNNYTTMRPEPDRKQTEQIMILPQMAKNRSVESRLGGVTEVLACVGQSCRCYY